MERAFRGNYRQRSCRPCKDLAREQRRRRRCLTVKARDVLRRHAPRLGIEKNDLITVYGWDPQTIAHDAEHQYTGRCNYCNKRYAEMGRGLGDITLDIQDRNRGPYYRTNTKWCCQGCNRKKGVLSPEEFKADLQIWDLWERSKDDPPEQGMLF
jgi:hypothetical protein